MFNPEQLLGKMVHSTLGKGMGKKMGKKVGKAFGMKGMGSAAKGALAMGALGVAIAAFDHFTQKQPHASSHSPYPFHPNSPQPYQPAQPSYSAQPPLPPGHPGGIQSAPSGVAVPPPPPGAPAPQVETREQADAVLLIKAMIAAAHADGVLDQAERKSILSKLTAETLTSEEKQYITETFISPPSVDEIVDQVTSEELAQQVYAVSFMTIQMDTVEEKEYMKQLALKLHLSLEQISQIHTSLQ